MTGKRRLEIILTLALCVTVLTTVAGGAYLKVQRGILNDSLREALVQFGDLPPVKEAVSRGANVNVVGRDGTSALQMACREGDFAFARELLNRGADPHLGSEPPIHSAVVCRSPKAIRARPDAVPAFAHRGKHRRAVAFG